MIEGCRVNGLQCSKKTVLFCMCVALASPSQPLRHGGPSEASQHPQIAALVRPVVSSLFILADGHVGIYCVHLTKL